MEEDAEAAAAFSAKVADFEQPDEAVLHPELRMYYLAWSRLRYSRQYGAMGGEFPITYDSIDRYAQRYGLVGVAFEHFYMLLVAMDSEYLTFVHEKYQADKAKRDAERDAERGAGQFYLTE